MQRGLKAKGLRIGILLLFIGASIFSGMTFKTAGFPENPTRNMLFNESSSGEKSENTVISTWFPENMRWRQVTIQQEIITFDKSNEGDVLKLNLFDNETYECIINTVTINVLGVKTIYGSIIGDFSGTFILTVSKEHCYIVIRIPEINRLFIVQFDGSNNVYYLIELGPHQYKELPDQNIETPGNPSEKIFDESRPGNLRSSNIDVMIVYTPAAKAWADSIGIGINNVISQAITNGIITHSNSNTFVNWNLVHAAEINYVESGDSLIDLERLTITNDGYMDEVHTWRNQYGADLVQLFEQIEDVGGLGWLLDIPTGDPGYGFSLVRVQQASSGYTSIHEFGHNMGCHHHKEQLYQPGPGLFDYSAGWRWVDSDDDYYCTVMTYQSGEYFPDGHYAFQVPYFSNPDVYYEGYSTGDVADGDNARTIREIRDVIASYVSGTGNHPPYANTPDPADGSEEVPITLPAISWNGGDVDGDVVWYDVYFEANDPTPDNLVDTTYGKTWAIPSALNYFTHYYWKIVAHDEHGATNEPAEVWDFWTENIPGPGTSHACIFINGNSGFTPEHGVVSGSGTSGDPYIISNWDIQPDSSEYGIRILSTTAYFKIRNVRIHDGVSYSGVRFYNVNHGTVENCQIYNNKVGIGIIDSYNCLVQNNDIYTCPTDAGISLSGGGPHTIRANKIFNCFKGLTSQQCNGCTIQNNQVYIDDGCPGNETQMSGIIVGYSSGNTVSGNIIYNLYEKWSGLALENEVSDYVSDNQIYDCGHGIRIADSHGNTLVGNTLWDNKRNFGFTQSSLDEYSNTIGTSNTVNGKPIYFLVSQSNTVLDGALMDIGYVGLVQCQNITVKNLDVSYNFQGVLLVESENCVIENCSFYNHSYGIGVISSNANIIRRTFIHDISSQTMPSRTLELFNSYDNSIYNNYVDSFVAAYDDGANNYNVSSLEPGPNIVNGPYIGGNYWKDYTGLDSNDDGIGDTPYIIYGGTNIDYYPLVPQEVGENQPPTFGAPSPVNGTNNRPLSFTWSIPINDPDGDVFDFTIQCSNGQSKIKTGATNGSKALALSGLAYSTTYKVWVNATDPSGSGSYTRRWYTFTTQSASNNPPNQPKKPTGPVVRLTGQAGTYWANGTDPDGDKIQYRFDWNGSGSHSYSGWTSLVNSGTKLSKNHSWTAPGTFIVKVQSKDEHGVTSVWSNGLSVTVTMNHAPNKPKKPTGPSTRLIGQAGTYWANGTDPDGDKIQYRFDWDAAGSHLYSSWTSLVSSGTKLSKNHTWPTAGTFVVKVQSRDEHGLTSTWSNGLNVTVANHAPNQPKKPTGPTTRVVGQTGTYWTNGTDSDGDQIQYRFDWDATGAHAYSAWTSLVNSGTKQSKTHSWAVPGAYVVKVQSRDEHGVVSVWSNGLTVVVSV